ncbi:MAG: hypothetical protein PWP23_2033 [Candidatus Sumerlaeota bacterium]|nr:hypothetical protein [Candidatus Sumerlaeota bacterium]
MKILHIDSEKGFRGGEQQVMLLMEGLRECGVAQALAARAGDELARRAREAGHEVHELPHDSIRHPATKRFLRAVVRRGGFSLVHAHTGNAHTLAYSCVHGRVPIVVTRRVDFPVKRNFLSRRKYRAPGVHFIAISNGVADVLRAGGVPAERLDVVFSGVDPTRFVGATGREALRREWEVTEPGPVFGMVGSYVDHKDPLNLVAAAALLARDASLPNARIVLVGEGELRPQLEDAIRRDALGNVLLTGWRQDIGDCLAAFDVFVMPSKLEGLCTSLLDAQAAGLPCIGTDTGGIPDVVRDGETGLLVPPRDPAALAAAMKRLWSDATLRARLREAGPLAVEARFSVQSMVGGTLAVYQRILAKAS